MKAFSVPRRAGDFKKVDELGLGIMEKLDEELGNDEEVKRSF